MKYTVVVMSQRGRHRLTVRIPARSRNEAIARAATIARNGRRVKIVPLEKGAG
jgi:hypothetical protein